VNTVANVVYSIVTGIDLQEIAFGHISTILATERRPCRRHAGKRSRHRGRASQPLPSQTQEHFERATGWVSTERAKNSREIYAQRPPAYVHALMPGFRWDLFLLHPMVFILWSFVAASMLFWGFLRLALPVRRAAGTD